MQQHPPPLSRFFDKTSLNANKIGVLSEQQNAMLESYRVTRRMSFGCFWIMMIFTLIGWSTMIFFAFEDQWGESGIPEDLLMMIIPFAITFIIILGFTLWGVRSTRNILNGTLSEAFGVAKKESVKIGKAGYQYRLTIGDVRFLFGSEKDLEGFIDGKNYHVYYVKYPPTHILLSAESF